MPAGARAYGVQGRWRALARRGRAGLRRRAGTSGGRQRPCGPRTRYRPSRAMLGAIYDRDGQESTRAGGPSRARWCGSRGRQKVSLTGTGGRCGGLGPRTRYAHRLGAHACRVGRKVGCGWPGLGLWASPGHRVGANWPALGPAGTDARILARD